MQIPKEKINEWINDWHQLTITNPDIIQSEQLTEQIYLAHCGALWGYTEGIIAIQSVYANDPEYQS